MADKISSSERYLKRSNRAIFVVGLLLLLMFGTGVVMVSEDSAPAGDGRLPPVISHGAGIDINVDVRGNKGGLLGYDPDAPVLGVNLVAKPEQLALDRVQVGAKALGVITLTAREAPILVLDAQLEEVQDGTFVLVNKCDPNVPLPQDSTCNLTVDWEPASARNIQNNITVTWQEVNPSLPSPPRKLLIHVAGSAVTSCAGGACSAEKVRELPVVAIGNDGTALGRVMSDGTVTGAGSVSVARALPDGTVLAFDRRSVVGRAFNTGPLMDEKGAVIGQIGVDGFVVDKTGANLGKLNPIGQAVNQQGKVIGYPLPRGYVMDAAGKILGEVKTDGSIANDKSEKVGTITLDGVALNRAGDPVGWLVPQGAVVSGPCRVVGFTTADGTVIDREDQAIGFVLPDGTAVTKTFKPLGAVVRQGAAVDAKGSYIGYVNAGGRLVDAKGGVSGCANPDGTVSADSGDVVGRVVAGGVVVNDSCSVLGRVRSDGAVIGDSGANVGTVNGAGLAFDKSGRIVGRLRDMRPFQYNINFARDDYYRGAPLSPMQLLSAMLVPVGRANDGLALTDKGGNRTACVGISGYAAPSGSIAKSGPVANRSGAFVGVAQPDGRVVDVKGAVIGTTNAMGLAIGKDSGTVVGYVLPTGPVMGHDGSIIGQIGADGRVSDVAGYVVGRAMGDGIIVGRDGTLVGHAVTPGFAVGLGEAYPLNPNGELIDKNGARAAWAAYDGTLLTDSRRVIGKVFPYDSYVLAPNGAWLGRFNMVGQLVDNGGKVIGIPAPDGRVYSDTTGRNLVGTLERPMVIVDDDGKVAGTSGPDGSVTNLRGEVIGRMLPGGMAVSPAMAALGRGLPRERLVLGAMGKPVGFRLPDGEVTSHDNRPLGRANAAGLVLSPDGIVGQMAAEGPVYASPASADNIGIVTGSGRVVDFEGAEIGSLMPGGIAVGADGQAFGMTRRPLAPRPIWGAGGIYVGVARIDGRGVDGAGVEKFVIKPGGWAVTAEGDLVGRAVDTSASPVAMAGGTLGHLRANATLPNDLKALAAGSIINAQGRMVGGWVPSSGAVVDGLGRSIGYITAAGRYVDTAGRLMGLVLPNGTVVDGANRPVGEIAKTGPALDLTGSYAGVALPGGFVGGRTDLRVGLGGLLHAADGTIAGQVAPAGPIIDSLGRTVGFGSDDGLVVAASAGDAIGRLTFTGIAVDASFRVIGAPKPFGAVIGMTGRLAGFSDVSGAVDAGGAAVGQVLSDGGVVSGGQYVGQVAPTGQVVAEAGKILGIAPGDGGIQAGVEEAGEAYVRDDGIAVRNGLPVGRVLPADTAVYKACGLAGFVDIKAGVVNAGGAIVGSLDADRDVLDFDGLVVGGLRPSGAIIRGNCQVVGVSAPGGKAQTFAGSEIGCVDSAGYVNNSQGEAVAVVAPTGAVVTPDNDDMIIGRALADGSAVGLDLRPLGCVSTSGAVVDEKGSVVGRVLMQRILKKNLPDLKLPAPGPIAQPPPPARRAAAPVIKKQPVNPAYLAALMNAQKARRANLGMASIAAPPEVVAKASKGKDWRDLGIEKNLSSAAPVDMSLMIMQDKPIPAVLVRTLDLRLSNAPVTAQVERNVYGEDGRNIIIPTGSRIIGTSGGGSAGCNMLTVLCWAHGREPEEANLSTKESGNVMSFWNTLTK